MIGDAMCSGSQEVKIKRRLNTIFFRKGNSNVGNVKRGSVVDSEVPNHLSPTHFFFKLKLVILGIFLCIAIEKPRFNHVKKVYSLDNECLQCVNNLF